MSGETKQYALDQIHEDPDLFYGVQRILQEAIEEGVKKAWPIMQKEMELEPQGEGLPYSEQRELAYYDGWGKGVEAVAALLQIDEIYDQPDGLEY